MRNQIVEGDDYSVLPAPLVLLLRGIRRLLRGRRGHVPPEDSTSGQVDRPSD